MSTLVFDVDVAGHHEVYLRRVTDALSRRTSVSLAVPDEMAERLADVSATVIALGSARERAGPNAFSPNAARRASAELALFDRAIKEARADHVIHMSADMLLGWLVRRPASRIRVSLLVFRPRAHYPRVFGSRLTARERLASMAFEHLLTRWRRRSDANAVLTLDPVAAKLWSCRPGARAVWFPEPPIVKSPTTVLPSKRQGFALTGSLAPRKGIHLVAAAQPPRGCRLVLAGTIAPDYEHQLIRDVDNLAARGVDVDLRACKHSEDELLDVVGASRCVLLPYPRHIGMSRVLLEAGIARTPVITHDFGLLGHLVRKHGLGMAIDCADPQALTSALETVASDDRRVDAYAAAMERFSGQFSASAFEGALRLVVADEIRPGPIESGP